MLDRLSGLSMNARTVILAVTIAAVLIVVNIQIIGKEGIVRQGDILLLRLAPRDPRSLVQGDYMALQYAMATTVAGVAEEAGRNDGVVIVEVTENGEAQFVALSDGQRLAANQRYLRFRKRGGTVRLATDAFFFEEGTHELYRNARFGELRVNAAGDAVLIGLRDGDGDRLGRILHEH